MEIEIEKVVREVFRRLGEVSNLAAPNLPEHAAERMLAGRVITFEEIDGKLDGVKTIVIEANAVVTPSAKDYLRQHGVRITTVATSAGGRNNVTTALGTLVLGIAAARFPAAGFCERLSRQGIEVETLHEANWLAEIDAMCDIVRKGTRIGMFISEETAAVVCLANRQGGVRAAAASSLGELRRAIDSIAVNLIVVDPTGRSVHEILQMAATLRQAGPRGCPGQLADRLK